MCSTLSGGRSLAIVAAAWLVSSCAAAGPRPALAPTSFADADSIALTRVADGVTYTFVHDGRGPWAIHIVEIDARACHPVLEARKPAPDLHARATTSELAAGALAAINADFFMLPRGTPVGAHVTDGVPFTGPVDRPVFAVTENGWRIGIARLDGFAAARNDTARIAQINRGAAPTSAYAGTTAGLTLFTTRFGNAAPADSSTRRVILRIIRGDEARGTGVVTTADSSAATAPIAPGTAVLIAHGPDRDWARRRAPGDTIEWAARVTLDTNVDQAVGGFPHLIRDGQPVLAQQRVSAAFANARHPRTALGWTHDQRLLLLAVDGRQPDWSAGMSLPELTWLFQRLGASDALNLDGGGSTALVIDGRLINRTSDRGGERAVGNALALSRCAG